MPNDGRTTSSKKDVVQTGRLHGGDSACRTTSQKSKYLIFRHLNAVTWRNSCSDWLKFESKNAVLKRFIQEKFELNTLLKQKSDK